MLKKNFNYLIVAAAIIGIGGFIWNWQKNAYSKSILMVEILGPSEITLGQETEYVVRYKNKSDFRLDNPEMIFEAPKYSLKDGQFFETQILTSSDLGEAIYPGEEKTISFKLRILGKEGDVKIAKASISFQPKDLNARYQSSSELTNQIKSAPLTFDLDLPSKVASAKNFAFRINYFSNVDYPLTNLRVQVEYPNDYEFVSASPKPIEQTEWEIPVLNKSAGGRIEITGNVSGNLGEAKIFKGKLGIWKDGEFIVLKEASKGVELVTHSLYIRQEINSNPQYVAIPGEWLHYEIYVKNVGNDSVSNLFMVSQLEGDAFDFQTIKSDYGSFQAGDNSVVFDSKQVPSLVHLIPMQEGKVDFWIKLKDDLGNVNNPTLKNNVFVGQVKEEFITKIGSKLGLSQKVYYQDEFFGNSGPIPPNVGVPTTYTVLWNVSNYYSDVKSAKVIAILPQGIEITGRVFPNDQFNNFTFDSGSREVVWLIGDMKRGIGVTESPATIAFQVVLTPSGSQQYQVPNIIYQATASAEDSWTQSIIQATVPAVNASLPDDPTVTNGMVQ